MNNGYIKKHRKTMDSLVFSNPFMNKLFDICLFKAAWEDKKMIWNGKEVQLKAGQFITGRESLTAVFNKGAAKKYQINESSTWRYMKDFEKAGMLNIKSTNQYSVVTVLNWGIYQIEETERTTSEQRVNNKRTSSEHKEELKEVKEVKESNSVAAADKIPYKQIIEYLNEKTGLELKYKTKAHRLVIKKRWEEGQRLEDFKLVVDFKLTDKWFTDMPIYFQPKTLFGNKFDGYLNEAKQIKINAAPKRTEKTMTNKEMMERLYKQ